MSDKCPTFVRCGSKARFSRLAARFRSPSVEDWPIIFYGLLAVRCLLCPVRLGDLAPHRPDNIGKPPGGQL